MSVLSGEHEAQVREIVRREISSFGEILISELSGATPLSGPQQRDAEANVRAAVTNALARYEEGE